MSSHPDRWARVRELFDRVAELPRDEREAALRAVAGDDPALAAEVRELLAAADEDAAWLEQPWPLEPFDPEVTEPVGIRLGAYRLLREVGHGGMASVYEAARADEQFDKRVAVKLIRREVASDGLLRRFRQERQILAGLEHPNIARLLDGGLAPDGRPFLVMEFVDGEPITLYSRRLGLDVRERLRLFRTVCEAVQHAHRHLVVHRDLKPGNILVTGAGEVKLLDFGVAKLLPDPARPNPAAAETATVNQPLTPAYASPEQLRGEPVSTAADVYSLGVVLYELLTDIHPFWNRGRGGLDFGPPAKTSPVRPSQAQVPGGEDTAASPAGFSRRVLAGELDNIVLKALRYEPARRYASVEQFSEDVRRYLEGRPVLAQPDTVGYRARKFVTRHRAGLAAAVLVLGSLLAGVAAARWQARTAARERDRARAEATKAARISAFLAGMLRAPDPWVDGRDVKVSDLLAGSARRAAAEFAGEPDVLAEIQTAIGTTYAGLGSYDEADSLLSAALRIRRTRELPGSPALVVSLVNLAGVLLDRGDLQRAEPLLREAEAAAASAGWQDSALLADLKAALASMLQARGDWEGAAREQEEALGLRRRLLGPEHVDVAQSLNALAVVRGQQGDFGAAEQLLREALDIQRSARGPDHPDVGAGLSNLAFFLSEQGRLAEADSLFRAALEVRRRALGDDHPDVAWTRYGHAALLEERGDHRAAEREARAVLALRGAALPDEHPLVASCLQVLGAALSGQGRRQDAELVLRESLELRRAALPPGHWLIATAESVLGACLAELGRFPEAEPLLLGSLERLRETRGADSPRTREAAARVARLEALQAEAGQAGGRPDRR